MHANIIKKIETTYYAGFPVKVIEDYLLRSEDEITEQ